MKPFRQNPFNSNLAKGVARVGFRKWYERELLSGHAHMVLALLSVIGLLASLEAMREGSLAERAMDALFALVCAAISLWALRRYLFLLLRAEELANQATCPSCGEYGRFSIVAERSHQAATDVRCRRCNADWTISGE